MIEVNVELTKERYELATSRILEIAEGDVAEVSDLFADYFKESAVFLVQMDKLLGAAKSGILFAAPLEEKEKLNADLYRELAEGYDSSYCNPAYAVARLGKEYGTF